MWRWQIYQKLIADNEHFNGGLFEPDINWDRFVQMVNRIGKTLVQGRMRIPAKISFSLESNPQMGTVKPGLNIEPVDLSQKDFGKTQSYSEFVKIIEQADYLLSFVTRTNIPYYVFIDELEAYRGQEEIFFRDLRLIRDLMFTVKKINDLFQTGTKFVCSVRLEIINAINRFIQSNQLHKITQGYDERLSWEYNNTNSFSHPIMGILLKRIQNAEEKIAGHEIEQNKIIGDWFEPNVYNMHICTYILDNTWHKPRDIVRMLLSAQSKGSKEFSRFNQNTFETFMPVYSKQCLVEVREEMRALYTEQEIEHIFSCLQGYKTVFGYQEIVERAKALYPDGVFARDPYTVMKDMYRVGVVGNIFSSSKTMRWAHKEQYTLFIDDPWKIIIHPALRSELSVSSSIDSRIKRSWGKWENRRGTTKCIL